MSHIQQFYYKSPSPSSSSSTSSPEPQHVVCNPPLVAPRPLPYHSPTFLQFELPDLDQDLSHPPYTRRSSKRKRTVDDHTHDEQPQNKRTVPQQPPATHSHRPDRTAKKHTRVYT